MCHGVCCIARRCVMHAVCRILHVASCIGGGQGDRAPMLMTAADMPVDIGSGKSARRRMLHWRTPHVRDTCSQVCPWWTHRLGQRTHLPLNAPAQQNLRGRALVPAHEKVQYLKSEGDVLWGSISPTRVPACVGMVMGGSQSYAIVNRYVDASAWHGRKRRVAKRSARRAV